ncbi:DNA replication licensing factor mcm10 [Acrodontium crateriforme]|uniref:DNA replication licensing factor mcm10 n=1 Tax=Acrodontium crateriforme TaxID=150365 RepID=A0AAQ3MCW7_9PEZI|nr:DNA replication licensing factor mcm10 [Acrodontium crateriforme]
MVVVPESPRAKVSPDKDSSQWPPKSPFQALMSSPSGRKKWRDYSRRDDSGSRSPSPSPRKAVTTSAALRALSDPFDDGADEDDDEDEDEDEEMMKLKLQEIQAKLKLKELQRQRKKARQAGGAEQTPDAESRPTSQFGSGTMVSPRRVQRTAIPEHRREERGIEVPLSPTKDRITVTQQQLSPARVRLGLTTATRAYDVSLKRARGTGTRAHSALGITKQATDSPRSFSERLAASRLEASEQQAKQDRIAQSRSEGFGTATSGFSQAKNIIQKGSRSDLRSKVESMRSPDSSTPSTMSKGGEQRVAPPSSTLERNIPRSSFEKPEQSIPLTHRNDGRTEEPRDDTASSNDKPESSSFDPFSEIHLTKRLIPHIGVARAVEESQIYTLPRLLKEVKAPHYEAPDCEGDFVVFAILASKSSPYDQKAKHLTSDSNKPQEDANAPRNKFMVLKLCDLEWEVDCFLFGTAFDQFWKLTPGTLLAILNPAIMPPKTNQHSGRFTLKLGSSEDSVMEIGVARDLGYCVSMKKDGQLCGTWVDKRKTEICEFHLNLLVEKQRKGRMEVNTMWRGAGTSENRPGGRSQQESSWGKKKANGSCHGEYGRLYAVPTGLVGKSAATLLDDDDIDKLHNMTREEASRKRIATAQRERDLAKRLGEMGNGVGAEYLRASTAGSTSTCPKPSTTATTNKSSLAPTPGKPDYFEKPKIADLGLLGNKASAIRLSPAKDRKRHFGLGTLTSARTTGGGKEAMGWGGARKAGLWGPPSQKPPAPPTSSKDGTPRASTPSRSAPSATKPAIRAGLVRERSHDELFRTATNDTVRSGSQSPRKKRARFALEKGIREPGRESLGGEALGITNDDDDDDDGLDIIA